MMLPEEVYKRRHYGTPQSFFLIIVNYIVLILAMQFFVGCTINYWFWISMGLLAAYNVYQLRREREEYDKARIIAYVISLAGLILLFFVLRSSMQHC
jgi:4-hydroxybenzoate polyprenyltransferase